MTSYHTVHCSSQFAAGGQQIDTDTVPSAHTWQPNASRVVSNAQNDTAHQPQNVRHTHTHAHTFNGPLSGTTRVGR